MKMHVYLFKHQKQFKEQGDNPIRAERAGGGEKRVHTYFSLYTFMHIYIHI